MAGSHGGPRARSRVSPHCRGRSHGRRAIPRWQGSSPVRAVRAGVPLTRRASDPSPDRLRACAARARAPAPRTRGAQLADVVHGCQPHDQCTADASPPASSAMRRRTAGASHPSQSRPAIAAVSSKCWKRGEPVDESPPRLIDRALSPPRAAHRVAQRRGCGGRNVGGQRDAPLVVISSKTYSRLGEMDTPQCGPQQLLRITAFHVKFATHSRCSDIDPRPIPAPAGGSTSSCGSQPDHPRGRGEPTIQGYPPSSAA